MAKTPNQKLATKAAKKKPSKPRLKPFDVHFYLEGGTSMWMQARAESCAALEERWRGLLEGPGTWMTLKTHSGVLHVRRDKVVGFLVDDLNAKELRADMKKEEADETWSEILMRLDDRDIALDVK